MGASIIGQICFGVLFDEGYPFPWDEEEYDFDIGTWWLKLNNFKPPFPYDADASRETKERYFEYKRDFEKQHPLPVDLIASGSCDYPVYILAIPRTIKTGLEWVSRKI